jgi:serine protease
MLRIFCAVVLTATSLLFASNASAFIGEPYLLPANPVVGETISVNVLSGECDAIGSIPGWPKVSRSGNAVRIDLWSISVSDPLLCIYWPPAVSSYSIGELPAGAYTLQVDREFMGDFGGDNLETLATLPFVVTGSSEAAPLPSLGETALALLALMLCVAAMGTLRRRGTIVSIVLVLVLVLGSAFARRAYADAPPPIIELLLTTAPGAPSPDDVIAFLDRPRGSPPLAALNVENPVAAQFLIAQRADGDFLRRLQDHPDSVRAKLERYLIVTYPPDANIDRAVAALRSDPYVASAQPPVDMQLDSVSLSSFRIDGDTTNETADSQYGRAALDVDAAWAITGGGYALVADIDTGLFVGSPWLRQFSGSNYTGGNFVPVASLDVSGRGITPIVPDNVDVDERRPVLITDPSCSPSGPSMMRATNAGHGTHTAGLIAANAAIGGGVAGTCKHCGVAMWKIEYAACGNGVVQAAYNPVAVPAALTVVADIGANVVNMSFGGDRIANYCASIAQGSPPALMSDTAMCLSIQHARYRDVAMVGAAGNDRHFLQFPANDDRVIAVGGLQQNLAIWDDSPGNATHCPYLDGRECGSDWTYTPTGPRQELMASAKSVLSTTYPGFDWTTPLKCGDGFGPGGGTGLCTGTSMSAPQVAGIVGLVRSINPLVPIGMPRVDPATGGASVRSVIASTTFEAQALHPWSLTLGYGRPDAAAAAYAMLGTVAGAPVRNRATPLFRLRSAGAHDYADTTSPQTAVAWMINATMSWQPVTTLPLVPGYAAFPHDPAEGALAAPRASVYVLTTNVRPRPEWPDLVPLYLMDKTFASARDFMLVTTVADIEAAHRAGYALRTIQGYVYAPCTPEPACIPPGAQKFWRKCAGSDCATFIESERAAFESGGYVAAYPPNSNPLLGYAYPATDTDHDGLPDGFEVVAGLDPTRADSDADQRSDATEFPMVGVPVSDPCGGVGSAGSMHCPADVIFRNGFDRA